MKTRTLHCNTTRLYESLLQHHLSKVGATILNVERGTFVSFDFSLPEKAADGLIALLNEAAQGQIVWRNEDSAVR